MVALGTIFVTLGLGFLYLYLFRDQTGGGDSVSSPYQLSGTFLPPDEVDVIQSVATQYQVDARLLAAIRRAENGGPGKEFGILSVPAPTFYQQAVAAAQTVYNNQRRYEQQTGQSSVGDDGRVTAGYLAFLAARYAPVGASNDPTNLNVNWLGNVSTFYNSINYVA